MQDRARTWEGNHRLGGEHHEETEIEGPPK